MFGVPGHNHPSELRVRSNACAMEHLFVWREGRVLSTTTYGCAPTTSVAGDALARGRVRRCLSDNPLSNTAIPFFVFPVLFLILSKVCGDTTTTTTKRT